MNASFEKMIQRDGAYSLPWLISLHNDDNSISMLYVNDAKKDIVYDGKTYKAGTFSYVPNAPELGFDGGGKLEITVKDNHVIDLVEQNLSVRLEVVGIIDSLGEITPLSFFKHHYGKVNVDRKKASFTFNKDDRLTMTFPTLIWTNRNNKGTA